MSLVAIKNWGSLKSRSKKKNFQLTCFDNKWNEQFKMNKIVNKFLLAGENYMAQFHLR